MRKAIDHLKRADPILARIIEAAGPYRIGYSEPEFHSLARSIIFQQLSGKVATVIAGRLDAVMPGGRVTPEGILSQNDDNLRACGLSGQKVRYLRDLAERTISGEIAFERLGGLADEEVVEHLTRVKGVGVWTAHMFLIFALRRPDVLPVGDLGVRTAMQRAYRMRKLPKPERMEKIASAWRPWCSVACWYLWRSLENGDAAQ